MRTMRINALSVFLAIKYAAIVMAKTNPSAGKSESGGSIILTASGEFFRKLKYNVLSRTSSRLVAGLRSGSGPIDCKFR